MPTKITKVCVGCKVDTNSKEFGELVKIALNKEIAVVKLKASDNLFSVTEQ